MPLRICGRRGGTLIARFSGLKKCENTTNDYNPINLRRCGVFYLVGHDGGIGGDVSARDEKGEMKMNITVFNMITFITGLIGYIPWLSVACKRQYELSASEHLYFIYGPMSLILLGASVEDMTGKYMTFPVVVSLGMLLGLMAKMITERKS